MAEGISAVTIMMAMMVNGIIDRRKKHIVSVFTTGVQTIEKNQLFDQRSFIKELANY
ncbi:MAG TPA: hypothetical protein PKE03_06245 [Bacteroidales bacterium]|nr:hypothetical protein [Bacteroidales bacterium]